MKKFTSEIVYEDLMRGYVLHGEIEDGSQVTYTRNEALLILMLGAEKLPGEVLLHAARDVIISYHGTIHSDSHYVLSCTVKDGKFTPFTSGKTTKEALQKILEGVEVGQIKHPTAKAGKQQTKDRHGRVKANHAVSND